MTLIAATIEPGGQRAWLAMDTLAQGPDGRRFEISKFCLLPQVSAVVAGRGQLDMVTGTHRWMAASIEVSSATFDELSGLLTEVVDQGFHELQAHAQKAGVQLEGCELAVIGWSEAEGRFVGVSVQKSPDTPATASRMRNGHMAPWDEISMGPCPTPTTPAEFQAAALAQTLYGRALNPELPIGGALELAVLTPGRVELQQLGRLTPPVAETSPTEP